MLSFLELTNATGSTRGRPEGKPVDELHVTIFMEPT